MNLFLIICGSSKIYTEKLLSQPPKCLDKNSTYFAFQNIGEYHEEETHLDS